MEAIDPVQAILSYPIPSGRELLDAARSVRLLGPSKTTFKTASNIRDVLSVCMNKCRGLLSTLQTALNALCPVNDLPDEVLSQIMVSVAQSIYYEEAMDDARPRVQWIALAQVCRTWRIVALATPACWAYIRQPSQQVLLELVERSKNAPLHITLSYNKLRDVPPSMFDHMAKQIRRARELRLLNLHDSDLVRFCMKLQTAQSASQLHRLVLNARVPNRDSPHVTILQPSLINLAGLRHLELRNVVIPWSNPLFASSLTRLTFTLPSLRLDDLQQQLQLSSGLGTCNSFQTAMKSLAPTLEVLNLSYSIPGPEGEKQHTSIVHRDLIPFPRLRHVTIASSTDACAHLLEPMVLPKSNCSIDLDLNGCVGFEDIAYKLCEYFSGCDSPLLSMQVFFQAANRMTIHGWTTCGHLDEDSFGALREEETFALTISLPHHNAVAPHPSVLHSILLRGANFLESIQELDMSVHQCDEFDWSALFARVSNLKVLHADSKNFERALRCVQNSAQDSPGQPVPVSVPVPHLRSIHLQGIRFHDNTDHISRGGSEEQNLASLPPPSFFDGLRDALETRAAAGVRLEELSIEDCEGVATRDVEKLRIHVARVDWNAEWYARMFDEYAREMEKLLSGSTPD